jgi:hypothetical protein
MRRRIFRSALPVATVLLLGLLLYAGGLAAQHSGAGERAGEGAGVVVGSGYPGGLHLPALVEAPDSGEASPVGSERINALALGLFLVSLGVLLGAGLAGRELQHRLEALRLAPVRPWLPARVPLSALQVLRL